MSEPILDRVRRSGASADVPDEPSPETGDPAVVRRGIDRAAADPTAAGAAYAEAAGACSIEALDETLSGMRGWRLFGRRGRYLEAARVALREATGTGAVRLAAAVVGELGEKEDAAALEALGVHPSLTLHAATALANLKHVEGRSALLRLLHGTSGAGRVVVIDRLLAFVGTPAVRLALVRDALTGLDDEFAREIAPAIAEWCDVRGAADDPSAGAEVRAGARRILELSAAR